MLDYRDVPGPGFDANLLLTLLRALGAHLHAAATTESVVVVGGAAMSLRGWVQRTTQDVDVIAAVSGEPSGAWSPPVIGAQLARAIARVARDFNLEDDWFNVVVGSQWRTGLPDGIQEGVEWLRFGGLNVGLASRQSILSLKLCAAVDQWPSSVHLQDLLALSPTDQEIERARQWVERQDTAPEFPAMVEEVVAYVRTHR